MKTFADNAGRTWSVSLNVEGVKRVRSLCEVDLIEAVGGKLLERITSDPVLLCDVLFAICKEEADTKGVSDIEFGRSLAGDAIDLATTALLEELIAFFPTEAKRRVLGKAMSKLTSLQTRALAVAEARLDSPELEREMEQALSGIGNSSGSLPASSASIPAH